MNAWKQIRAILLLPGVVAVAIPGAILYFTGGGRPPSPWNVIAGSVLVLLGVALIVSTSRLFATIGQGTMAPWDPPQKLVVRGIYRHVRNPMLSGAVCVLLGEEVFCGSLALLGWFAFAATAYLIYVPLLEEAGLARRFGEDYLLYKRNVPRWIPRLTAWQGLAEERQAS